MRACVVALLSIALVAPAARAWEVGVAPGVRKVLPHQPVPGETTIELAAARNEWEGVQVVIRDDGGLTGVDVTVGDLTGPGGAALSADRVRTYREHFLDIEQASPFGVELHEREPGLYPDPLIPLRDPYEPGGDVGAPFDVAAAAVGVVWIDDDPWNQWAAWDYFPPGFARNGDGFLLYPGDHDGTAGGKGSPDDVSLDGPVVSYRLKQIRDGLEDWEMFLIAEELGGGDYAREQVARAYTRFGDNFMVLCGAGPNAYCEDDQPWTLDEAVLADARANIAAKILYLTDPDTYPDPEAEVPEGEDEPPPDEGGGCGACASAGPVRASMSALVLATLAALAGRRRI